MELNQVLLNSDLRGVLCMEFASRVHNMSTFPSLPIMMFREIERDYNLGPFVFYSQPNLDLNYVVDLREGLHITNKARTIVDMVRIGGPNRFAYESLNQYVSDGLPVDDLEEVASHYSCLHEIRQFMSGLDEWLIDHYE